VFPSIRDSHPMGIQFPPNETHYHRSGPERACTSSIWEGFVTAWEIGYNFGVGTFERRNVITFHVFTFHV
jgi:hypothetical protein